MKIAGVLSMLHERAGRPDSATRRFRGEAPLAWTLFRLGRSKHIAESAVICWEDQASRRSADHGGIEVAALVAFGANIHPASGRGLRGAAMGGWLARRIAGSMRV